MGIQEEGWKSYTLWRERSFKEGNGQRWLMIPVEDKDQVYEEVLRLIEIRRQEAEVTSVEENRELAEREAWKWKRTYWDL